MAKRQVPGAGGMRALSAITRALADESRLRLLAALAEGELCVCQLTALLDLATSTVSKHLTQLRDAGLVESRKDGRWVYYRLPDRNAPPAVRRALELVREALADDPLARRDARRLERIRSVSPQNLCELSRGSDKARRKESRRVRV